MTKPNRPTRRSRQRERVVATLKALLVRCITAKLKGPQTHTADFGRKRMELPPQVLVERNEARDLYVATGVLYVSGTNEADRMAHACQQGLKKYGES